VSLYLNVPGGAAQLVKHALTVPGEGAVGEVRLAPDVEKVRSQLQPALVGRVVLPDGSPASLARVVYIPGAGGQVPAEWVDAFSTTGADGGFTMALPAYFPAEGQLYVRDASGRFAAVVKVEAKTGGVPVDIKLMEGGYVRGRAVDEQGKPVVGWTVVYNRVDAHWGGGGGGGHAYPRPRFASAFTDAQGNYELRGVLPVTAEGGVEIALVPDLLIVNSTMMPGRADPARRGHRGLRIVAGQTREGVDFEVGTVRRGEYRITPVVGGGR
jgi:hypothetical protein